VFLRGLVCLGLLVLYGCGASNTGSKRNYGSTQSDYSTHAQSSNSSDQPHEQFTIDRQIIVSAHLTLETETPDTIQSRLPDLAIARGGHVLSSQDNTTTIRIAAMDFRDALAEIELWANVLDREIFGQDVTEQYEDLEIRLANTIATRDRYLALLERAHGIDDMLELEHELERLSREIDQLEGKLNKLTHRVEYATITVTAELPDDEAQLGPVSRVLNAAYSGVKWMFIWD